MLSELKKYTSAPLPFQGQKRAFLNDFCRAVHEIDAMRHISTVVDLFGGSGLLSHAAKYTLPQARVVWNDYDDYQTRLDGIPGTNELIRLIASEVGDIKTNSRMPADLASRIAGIIADYGRQGGYVDHLTMSSILLFSGNYASSVDDLISEGRRGAYYRFSGRKYDATGYLSGVERVRANYRDLVAAYAGNSDVLLVFDPPYAITDIRSYNKGTFQCIIDYMEVVKYLRDNSYVYFTSSRSGIIDIFKFLEREFNSISPLTGSKSREIGRQINNNKYCDMMYYRAAVSEL
jgi:hypothetical protein